jgi:hypothetical protein
MFAFGNPKGEVFDHPTRSKSMGIVLHWGEIEQYGYNPNAQGE